MSKGGAAYIYSEMWLRQMPVFLTLASFANWCVEEEQDALVGCRVYISDRRRGAPMEGA